MFGLTTPELLSVTASVIGIIGGPLSVFFAWRAAKNAGQAVKGADELARRLTPRALYDAKGKVLDHQQEL